MAKHLGRNPFSKRRKTVSLGGGKGDPSEIKAKAGLHQKNATRGPLRWLLVDLPAESFLFALKAAILVKSAFEKK